MGLIYSMLLPFVLIFSEICHLLEMCVFIFIGPILSEIIWILDILFCSVFPSLSNFWSLRQVSFRKETFNFIVFIFSTKTNSQQVFAEPLIFQFRLFYQFIFCLQFNSYSFSFSFADARIPFFLLLEHKFGKVSLCLWFFRGSKTQWSSLCFFFVIVRHILLYFFYRKVSISGSIYDEVFFLFFFLVLKSIQRTLTIVRTQLSLHMIIITLINIVISRQ